MTKSKIPLKAGKLFILVILLLVSAPVFAQSVDTAWVRRYNGPANSYDGARAVAVDDSGYVYVTGDTDGNGSGFYCDYATIKYYPNGDTAWLRRYGRPADSTDLSYAIAVDDSGYVYVTGSSGGSYATIKYYRNGDTAWVRRYNGPVSGVFNSDAYAITVDDSGNVYVTGRSYYDSTYYDYATIKYYPNGDTAWVRRYSGPISSYDQGYAIAVDDSGYVYVTGESAVEGINADYATIKYYPNGDTAWLRRYNGPGDSLDYANAIAVDGSGNVYVTGYSFGAGTGRDYTTVKYAPNGDELWVRRYNGPANSDDLARAIVVDDSGNVYVTGWINGNDPYADYGTIKYYPNGDTAWVRRYNGPGNSYDLARAIAVDGSGNVYVSGQSLDINADYATIKYYPNGDTAWLRRYNGSGNSGDGAYAIAVDGSGNVYATGYSVGSGTDYDYATIKYVQFLCGDVNKDGVVNVTDVVYLINYLFIGGPAPVPILHVGDVNQDEVVNVTDVVYLINHLFIGGPAPCS